MVMAELGDRPSSDTARNDAEPLFGFARSLTLLLAPQLYPAPATLSLGNRRRALKPKVNPRDGG